MSVESWVNVSVHLDAYYLVTYGRVKVIAVFCYSGNERSGVEVKVETGFARYWHQTEAERKPAKRFYCVCKILRHHSV